MSSAGAGVKELIILKGVPILIAYAAYASGMSWHVPVIILLTAPYWYGPVVVYFQQRMPKMQGLRVVGENAALPPDHGRFFERVIPALQSSGFVVHGRFTSDDQQPICGTVTLMQHQGASDLAHLVVVTKNTIFAEMVGFSRARTDGSQISTLWSTVQSPFPPNPRDDVLRIGGNIDPMDLWRVHQARVAADPTAKPNDLVTDALAYQTNLEREGIRRHIASGMWQQDEHPGFLRPTVTGAILMCLRMLFPWKQVARMRARMEVRRLRESKETAVK